MAQKTLLIPELGEVTIRKRKGARNIRLSVTYDGKVKVSIPAWSPYQAGEDFAFSKKEWLIMQVAGKTNRLFAENDRIGKGHRLRFINVDRANITCRVGESEIITRLPYEVSFENSNVQAKVKKAAVRALKQEAEILLPKRLSALAQKHKFTYRSVTIKRLKTRWGSCSSNKDIALNCFLVQLPWELIDYVIMHELLHTRIMAHGQPFWSELNNYIPDLKTKRIAIRAHHPAVIAAV